VKANLARRLFAEGLGTALLLAIVIGSGIMGERLAGGNTAIALLANSLATGCGLAVLVGVFRPISGAHFNPAVTLVAALDGELNGREAATYMVVQIAAAFAGTAVAHLMFAEPIFSASMRIRTDPPQWLSEAVATFGLVVVILGFSRQKLAGTALAVAAYITAAYWFTASTSFANPAVTLARAASNTFAGIRPADMPAFVIAQFAGALVAMGTMRWLLGRGGKGPL
jgi:glycerol uptake facilitator-like aquaporin